jgi:pyruvate/2-oxoglutarate dehydrogenase complex dihydrolipoamide acyltransferase (E2) component
MSEIKNIQLPDIGDFDEVEVIEILVSVGDTIEADDSIITLESDKASMEIPAPCFIKVTNIWHHHRYDFWFSIDHFCD